MPSPQTPDTKLRSSPRTQLLDVRRNHRQKYAQKASKTINPQIGPFTPEASAQQRKSSSFQSCSLSRRRVVGGLILSVDFRCYRDARDTNASRKTSVHACTERTQPAKQPTTNARPQLDKTNVWKTKNTHTYFSAPTTKTRTFGARSELAQPSINLTLPVLPTSATLFALSSIQLTI